MNKIGKSALLSLYIIIVVFVTILVLNLNSFGFPTFGDTTIFPTSNRDPFNNGTIVIIQKNLDDIGINDTILYFNSYSAKNEILESSVISIEKTNEEEVTFFLDNDKYLSSEYVVGKTSDILSISYLGYIISFIITKLGYFLFVVIPILLILSFQVKSLILTYREKRVDIDVSEIEKE